jgi:ABC-type uncharacterized transport system substrate-binding protein
MIRRRELITLLGGAAAWPIVARAEQPAIPVVGFVYTGNTSSEAAPYVSAFHQGFPIVFFSGIDPVKVGLVASFNRPGGNVTGVSFLGGDLEAKRLGLLRELLPQAKVIAALVDAKFITAARQLRDLEVAAKALGLQIHVFEASIESELDRAFATIAQQRPDVLIVAGAPFFTGRRNRIIEFAARQSLPAMHDVREFPLAGGLISYGANIADSIRSVGVYTGRILKLRWESDNGCRDSARVHPRTTRARRRSRDRSPLACEPEPMAARPRRVASHAVRDPAHGRWRTRPF